MIFSKKTNDMVLPFREEVNGPEDHEEFKRKVQQLHLMGYQTKRVSFDPVHYAFLELQRYKVCDCLLKYKQINCSTDTEPVNNGPLYCPFARYREGSDDKNCICCKVKGDCLYKDTADNRKLLKILSKYFVECMNKDWTINYQSKCYEDTALGRIFTKEYENTDPKLLQAVMLICHGSDDYGCFMKPDSTLDIPRFAPGGDDKDVQKNVQ